MMRMLPLYVMAPEASFDGMTLVEGTCPNSESAQRIKEAMEPLWDDVGAALDFIYLVLGHPPMWPEPGYTVFVSPPFSCLFSNRFPDPLRLTLRGAGLAKGPHSHGSPGTTAEGFNREDSESRRGRAAEEGKGGKE